MSIAEKLTTIAENEQKVYDAGYEAGFYSGLVNVESMVEEREEEFHYEIWSMITNAGRRVDFRYTFYHTDYTDFVFINPIMPTKYAANMFNYYRGARLPGNINLSLIPITTTHGAMFAYSLLEYIDDINIPALNAYHNTFLDCKYLREIEIIRVHEKSTFFQTFNGCDALENVTFEGTIGNSIVFNHSTKLSKASILNIFEHLSSTVTGKTLTVSKPE